MQKRDFLFDAFTPKIIIPISMNFDAYIGAYVEGEEHGHVE